MKEMKVKSESPPKRCEICHKADSFNPITNKCSLCTESCQEHLITSIINTTKENTKQKNSDYGRFFFAIPAFAFSCLTIWLLSQYRYIQFKHYDATDARLFTFFSWVTLTSLYITIGLWGYTFIINSYILQKFNRVISQIFLLPAIFFTGCMVFILLQHTWFSFSLGIILELLVVMSPVLLICINLLVNRKANYH